MYKVCLIPEETRLLKQSYDAFINLRQFEEPIQDHAWNDMHLH